MENTNEVSYTATELDVPNMKNVAITAATGAVIGVAVQMALITVIGIAGRKWSERKYARKNPSTDTPVV